MTPDTILILIIASMIIVSITNFIKESVSSITKKKVLPVYSMLISFILWIIAAFSFDLWAEYAIWAKLLLGLALGTGSQIFYDILETIKSLQGKEE